MGPSSLGEVVRWVIMLLPLFACGVEGHLGTKPDLLSH